MEHEPKLISIGLVAGDWRQLAGVGAGESESIHMEQKILSMVFFMVFNKQCHRNINRIKAHKCL